MADWQRFQHRQVNVLAAGVYAYMQVGGWGFNNTLLLVSEGETLLVDATSDLPMTAYMLAAFARTDPAARRIDTLTFTHWHVDHVHGACAAEFAGTSIISTTTVADYVANLPPKAWLGVVDSLTGDAKKAMDNNIRGLFDFSGLSPIRPGRTFSGRLEFTVGTQRVVLVEAKHCHTASDTVVFFPDAGVAHLGDLTAANLHQGLQYPGMRNLIDILEQAAGWEADAYVVGHGPVMDLADLRDQIEYNRWLFDQARSRFDRGMPHRRAADDILDNLGRYGHRRKPANLYSAVEMMFAELAGLPDNHIRRNYPRYLAESYRLEAALPVRHPDLVAQ